MDYSTAKAKLQNKQKAVTELTNTCTKRGNRGKLVIRIIEYAMVGGVLSTYSASSSDEVAVRSHHPTRLPRTHPAAVSLVLVPLTVRVMWGQPGGWCTVKIWMSCGEEQWRGARAQIRRR